MAKSERSVPAFKEWQVVCAALAGGEQSLILRKGGIAEGRQGFQWRHNEFLLFPTRFHQQEEGVKGSPPPVEAGADGGVEISLHAEIVLKKCVTDWRKVQALADHHIWTNELVRERFEWGDEPGLNVALVRIRRLDQPWLLRKADRREFGGCRSWLDLPREEWMAEKTPEDAIADAKPVIGDDAFAATLDKMQTLLADFD